MTSRRTLKIWAGQGCAGEGVDQGTRGEGATYHEHEEVAGDAKDEAQPDLVQLQNAAGDVAVYGHERDDVVDAGLRVSSVVIRELMRAHPEWQAEVREHRRGVEPIRDGADVVVQPGALVLELGNSRRTRQ
jgi:hypothetical protein